MIISIGILAWNEAEILGTSLRSLFEQSLLKHLPERQARVEIVVVPNGCSDNTAPLATETLRALAAPYPADRLTWRVDSLAEPGKANAWNHYIHTFSNPDADILILMDADISFSHPDTLANMADALGQNPEAAISTDLPQKHVLFKKRKTLFDRISLAVGSMTQAAPGQVTGQLYAGRGPLLRRIYMPQGLIADDGFLKVMACTDFFRRPADNSRIIRAPNASHVFESYTRLTDIFFNQRRQQIAHSIYVFLRDYLKEAVGEKDAGEVIRDNNQRDPDWYRKLIRQRVKEGGWWVMYPTALTVRFKRLSLLPPLQALLNFPVALAGFLMDVVVLAAANHKLKSGTLAGIWKDTKTTDLPPVSV